MKIALVTSKYPRQTGTFDQREINGLRQAGADLTVFPIYPLSKGIFDDPKVRSTLEGREACWEKVHHISFSSVSYFRGIFEFVSDAELRKECMIATLQYLKQDLLSFAKYAYSLPKAFAWCPLLSDSNHVISFWGNYSGTVAYFIARKLRIPFSTYLHAGTDLYRDRAFLLEKLLSAHKIISVCKYNIDFLAKAYPEDFEKFKSKILLHHLGLDLSRYRVLPMDMDSPIFKICCVGSLEEHKGSLQVLKSFNALIKAGYRAELTFCGNGPLLKDLQMFCIKNNLNPFVHFKGICSVPEVNKALQASHVLVHGSPHIGDAVPTVIKEAMAMGRPVIATKVAGIPELVEHLVTGLLVAPNDINSMFQALKYLHKNRGEAKRMGLAGRTKAETLFDLWKNTESLLQRLQ